MSKGKPSIFQKLMDQLLVYSLNETHPDAFTVIRMKKEAKKILATNQALGASAYGIIAAVQGDLEESEKQHTIAIKLSRNPYYVMYRAISMRTLGKHAESYQSMQSIMKVMPKPVDLLNSEIQLAFDSGHHHDLKIFYDELARIKGTITIDALIRVYFTALIIRSNIDLDAWPFIAFLLNSLLKTHHIKEPITYVELNGNQLFYWIEISTDENTLNLLNEQVANGLALISPYNLDNFHAGFRPEQESREMKIEAIYEVIENAYSY